MKTKILALFISTGLSLSGMAANLVWSPSSASWDTASQNWVIAGTATRAFFADGDNVTFEANGTAQTSVSLVGLLRPSTVVVDAYAFLDYSFLGSSTAKLTNVFSLTKRGEGRLIVDSDSVITNLVNIEQGTLQLGNASDRGTLGTGYPGYTANVVNNGTLAFNRTANLSFSNNISGSGVLEILPTSTGAWNLYGANTMNNYAIVHKGGSVLYFRTPGSVGAPASISGDAAQGKNIRIQMGGGITLPESCPISATLAYDGGTDTRFLVMGMAGVNSVNGPISLAGDSSGTTQPTWGRTVSGFYAQGTGSELNVYSSVSESDPVYNPFRGIFWLRGTGVAGRMYGTINLPNAQLVKVDSATWTLYASGNEAFETAVTAGRLTMGVANALPVAPLTLASELDLAGFDQKCGPLWGAGTILNSSTTTDVLLTLANGGVYLGSILDSGTAKIGIRLLNPGMPQTQQLIGNPAYRGPTILDVAAAIAIGNQGLPNSTPIEMADGTSIDATTVKDDDTFTLGAAQTLKAVATANIAGNFINNGTIELSVSKSAGVVTAAKVVVTGQITYGGTLSLQLTGESLAAGDVLPVFQASTYGTAPFAEIIPATPGPGLVWDTSDLGNGNMKVSAAATPPQIDTITLSVAGELVFGGTGGTPNGSFSVVSSTDLLDPISTWTPVQTGLSFDNLGGFSVTNLVNSGESKRFFKIVTP